MIPETVSNIELVWIVWGLFTMLVLAMNFVDVLADRLLMNVRKIVGMKLQAAKDNLRNEVFLIMMELACLAVGFAAAGVPARENPEHQWASSVIAVALLSIHTIIMLMSLWNRASRKAMLKLYIPVGETLITALEKERTHKRRASDPPLSYNPVEVIPDADNEIRRDATA